MTLAIGNKVIYPCQGPCLIGAVVERIVDDRPMMFYQLLALNNGGGKLFVPVDNIEAIGIRPLLKKSEIPKLLEMLKKPTRLANNRLDRTCNNLKLLTSGSAFALAEIIESLTKLSETKALSFGDSSILERAKKLLICEVAEVMRETEEEAEKRVEQALKAGREERTSVLLTERDPTA